MEDILNEFGREQSNLIYILHKVQAKYGYIPAEAVSQVAERLKITENEIFSVLTFYKAFSLKPRGSHLVTICLGTACHVRGAPMVLDEVRRRLGIEPNQTTEDRMFTLETVNCVGACALGPIVIIDGIYHGQMRTRDVKTVIEKYKQEKKEKF